jgi:anti-sigma B factor antagonist
MTLRITITEEADTLIMALAGKIDSVTADELQEGFEHVKEAGKPEIILLLKDLEYIDSRGIGAFVSFIKAIRNAGGVVRLAEAPPKILELLNALGVEGFAEVYPSLPQALKNSRGKGSTHEIHQEPEQVEDDHYSQGDIPSANKAPYVLAGAGIVIVVILVFLFLKPAKRVAGPESDTEPRLELLERRVARLESQIAGPSPAEEKVESLSRGVSERLSLIENDLSRLKEDMESLKKKSASAALPEKAQAPPGPSAYHVVSRGETLYRIALRYNMTVDELRSLNNLKPDQALLMGQRLLVKPQ